jgi:F0F1-type ATP synthase delta subunit
MKRNEERLGMRYAKAVYSQLQNKLTEAQFEHLLSLANELENQRSLIVLSQMLSKDGKVNSVVEEFFDKAGFGTVFRPLIGLLTKDRRLVLLPIVLRVVYALYLEDKGIMYFVIESPVELTEQERVRCLLFLQKQTGKEIRYTLKSNPDLIAGVKMYSDTLGYEHSIQQKLYQL